MSTAHNPAFEAEKWMSRADAAKLARRSEDVIKRDQKGHGLEQIAFSYFMGPVTDCPSSDPGPGHAA